MKREKNPLNKTRINRIRAQGYFSQTDAEITELAFGNRFAYQFCLSFFVIGLVFKSLPILVAIMVVAFLSVILPNHPFDYIYNHVIRNQLNKPFLPPRAAQLKFACGIATVWIGTVIYLLYSGLDVAGIVLGVTFAFVALLPSTIDICVPSVIYNWLFPRKSKVKIHKN